MANNEGVVLDNEEVFIDDAAIAKAYERYFGVCDVYSPEEARAMAEELRKERKSENRKVMIGVMTHPLVLHPERGAGIPECDGVREVFPVRENIAGGFTDDPDVLNTVHYADLYGPRKGQDLFNNLKLAAEYGGENMHAIQLDVTWPNLDEMRKFKDAYPQVKIILQLGKFSFKEAGNDPQKVVDRLREYGDTIDFALLDMSMGKGQAMETEGILPMLRLIKKELPNLGLAVAGGLGPDSIDLLEPIAKEFPGISFDAQGNLKPIGSPKDTLGHLVSTIPADLGRSNDYIQKSCEMLDNPPQK